MAIYWLNDRPKFKENYVRVPFPWIGVMLLFLFFIAGFVLGALTMLGGA